MVRKSSIRYFSLRAFDFNFEERIEGRAETSHGVNSSATTDGWNCISDTVSDWCATTWATRVLLTSRICENLECVTSAAIPDLAKPSAAFHDLAHDLRLAEDFLSGSAAVLRTAAAAEISENAEQTKRDMAHYVGDVRQRQHLRERFREGSYGQVVALAETLKSPNRCLNQNVEWSTTRARKLIPVISVPLVCLGLRSVS